MNIAHKLSIVIPVKNDYENFIATINSINEFCKLNCQIIIVDGGDEIHTKECISKIFNYDNNQLVYIRDNSKGVFPAQNLGIKASVGEWIQILNSGDLLNSEASIILSNDYLSKYDEFDILVFSQETYSDFNEKYKFTPNSKSVWPHQSILVKKMVYDVYGLYREDIKTCSEQLFFAQLRKLVKFKIIDLTLTLYKLGGISSHINLKISNDIFMVSRELGTSFIKAFLNAYITPILRKLSENILGRNMTVKFKVLFFKYYKSV